MFYSLDEFVNSDNLIFFVAFLKPDICIVWSFICFYSSDRIYCLCTINRTFVSTELGSTIPSSTM
jgi:hypothetical protein